MDRLQQRFHDTSAENIVRSLCCSWTSTDSRSLTTRSATRRGDELLRQIAQRLCVTLRDGESPEEETWETAIARFGGDEFLVLISRLRATSDTKRVADHMQKALAPAYTFLGRTVFTTASIGIVTSDQCREGAEAIVSCADAGNVRGEARRRRAVSRLQRPHAHAVRAARKDRA